MKRLLQENSAVHCLGNGRACAFVRGLDYFDVFGPHYSAPAAAKLTYAGERETVALDSHRLPYTAIWTHRVWEGESELGTVTEFADARETVIYRRLDFIRPVSFRLEADKVDRFYEVPAEATGIPGFYYGEIPEGAQMYVYSIDREKYRGFVNTRTHYFGFVATGDSRVERESATALNIEMRQGVMALLFAESFEELYAYARAVSDERVEQARTEAEEHWQALAARRLSTFTPADEITAQMCDDVYVLIKTRQSVTGGVLACYRGHMSYVRDNYGTMRGLLAMGALEDAREMLTFYLDTFRQYGAVHNAQGTDSYAFHKHENEGSEITGYILLTFWDYYVRTGDAAFMREALPLMRWCVEQQHRLLRRGMLPFNGDETYIAGFILPHEIIHHGSVEATILYHTACRNLLEVAKVLELTAEEQEQMRADMAEIEENFSRNFVVDGRLAVNCPDYYRPGEQPLFGGFVRLCGHGNGIGILDKSGRYVCFDCYRNDPRPNPALTQRFYLTSPLFMAAYVETKLIDGALMEQELDRIAEELIRNAFVYNPEKTTGYDPALLLLIFRSRRPELVAPLRQTVLNMRDAVGVWSEYYVNSQPNGAMYRPWESGISCEALLKTEDAC